MSHESFACPYCGATVAPAPEAEWKDRVQEVRAHLLAAHGYYHLPPSRTGEVWYRPEDHGDAETQAQAEAKTETP